MLGESGSLFYRPKDKKMHADKAKQNFFRSGGDMFMLLNIWEQWAEANYSQSYVPPFTLFMEMTNSNSLDGAMRILSSLRRFLVHEMFEINCLVYVSEWKSFLSQTKTRATLLQFRSRW